MSLIYNSATKRLLDQMSRELPQALLLVGEQGVGLGSIASDIAWHDIADVITPTLKEGSTSNNREIRIEQIRELIRATRGKTAHRSIYIIDDADQMNIPAQNAFLKLLEEPTPHVSFILTSHEPQQLLPTVLSRVQRVRVLPISRTQSEEFIKKAGITDTHTAQQLLFLASGRPAELSRLIHDKKLFAAQAEIIADARQFLQAPAYQKTIVVQKYAADRAAALMLLRHAIAILNFSLSRQPSQPLIMSANQLSEMYDRVAANGNVRLQLTTFVV